MNARRAKAMIAVALGMAMTATAFSVQQQEVPAAMQTVAAGLIEVGTEQESYRVDEPIRIGVNVERPAFLYLYTIDSATGEASLLEPLNGGRARKLMPGDTAWLPARSLEFYADAPGTERIVAVASERALDLSAVRAAEARGGVIDEVRMAAFFADMGVDVGQAGDEVHGGVRVAVRHLDVVVKPGPN